MESQLSGALSGVARWHLPAPAAASSPRKRGRGAAAAVFEAAAAPGSPAKAAVAVPAEVVPELHLAELAEPLPEAAAVEAAVAEEAAAAAAGTFRRLGGPLAAPATDGSGRAQLRLRAVLDGSALEVFAGGEVGGQDSTRVCVCGGGCVCVCVCVCDTRPAQGPGR